MITYEEMFNIIIKHYEIEESANFIVFKNKKFFVIKYIYYVLEYCRNKGFHLVGIEPNSQRFIFERR